MEGTPLTARRMILATLMAAWLLVPERVPAQKRDAVELTREAVQKNRHEIVQLAMDFTPKELESFKPLYREFRAKVEEVGGRKVELITRVTEKFDKLTDAEAKTLTDDWLKLQADELKLKKIYVERFRKILPEKKIARFFQLENKLDAAVLYNLAGTIPLVEQ